MKSYTIFSIAAAFAVLSAGAERVVKSFNDGWEFAKEGGQFSPVAVPHDWAIAGPFDPNGSGGTGKLPWKGKGRYRKTLVLAEKPRGRVFIEFDGVMARAVAKVNGYPAGLGRYGYLGFRAEATQYLVPGTNVVEVEADTNPLNSRWYPGAGLYRNVRLVTTDDVFLPADDVFFTTPSVTAARADASVSGVVRSRRGAALDCEVRAVLTAPDGRIAASAKTQVAVGAMEDVPFSLALSVKNPALWRLEPNAALYRLEVSLVCPGASDSVSRRVGLRSFEFTADDGFHLNGERVQLNGIDLHSDLGILGMAFNRSAMKRQLSIMRDMGANAFRTSHNPPAPEALDLCDEMGFFVWDECFDKWNSTSARTDEPLDDFVCEHLQMLARRDRNHPCVFLWSIGNEIGIGEAAPPGQKESFQTSALGTTAERCSIFRLAVRAIDATRPVGIGSCFPAAGKRGDYDALDVTGWNYGGQYVGMKRHAPSKPLLYSESASAFSDYGYYATRAATNKTDWALDDLSTDSYDLTSAAWSDIPDWEFYRMERDRYVGGEFVWTGTDYLGEPTPYSGKKVKGRTLPPAQSARSAYFGICDLLHLPKDRFYLYRSHWNRDAFTLHIVPAHWNFPEREGKKTPVFVYTSAPEAELFVNGKSFGRRRKNPDLVPDEKDYYSVLPRYRIMWPDVVYVPGEVTAVAYSADGREIGRETVRTAGAAAKVVLAPDAQDIPECDETGAPFLRFVCVTLADDKGVPVPRDNRRVSFAVEGPGEIVSVGNSDPRGHESFKTVSSHPLCNGRAGLFLRRTAPGGITLRASAPGLKDAAVSF